MSMRGFCRVDSCKHHPKQNGRCSDYVSCIQLPGRNKLILPDNRSMIGRVCVFGNYGSNKTHAQVRIDGKAVKLVGGGFVECLHYKRDNQKSSL